jgi:hypothetical protein
MYAFQNPDQFFSIASPETSFEITQRTLLWSVLLWGHGRQEETFTGLHETFREGIGTHRIFVTRGGLVHGSAEDHLGTTQRTLLQQLLFLETWRREKRHACVSMSVVGILCCLSKSKPAFSIRFSGKGFGTAQLPSHAHLSVFGPQKSEKKHAPCILPFLIKLDNLHKEFAEFQAGLHDTVDSWNWNNPAHIPTEDVVLRKRRRERNMPADHSGFLKTLLGMNTSHVYMFQKVPAQTPWLDTQLSSKQRSPHGQWPNTFESAEAHEEACILEDTFLVRWLNLNTYVCSRKCTLKSIRQRD